MLPIEFKEKLLNGKMCAFVSKEPEFNIGNEFYFLGDKDKIGIYNFNWITIGKNITSHKIAKAECVGVIKFKGIFTRLGAKKLYFGDQEIRIFLEWLGFDTGTNALKYFLYLLGNSQKGYLHIFKLIKE